MTTTATPNTVAEAEAALAALHERLVAGDQTVTGADFAAARAAVDFARARQAAAERAEQQRVEREQREREEAARARLAALDPAKTEQARQQLAAAIEAFVAEVAASWRELDDVADELAAAGFDARRSPAGLALGRHTVQRAPLQSAIRDAAEAAIRRHLGGRYPVNLAQPPD